MPSSIDLGFQTPDYSQMNAVEAAPAKTADRPMKTSYPSLTIPGNDGLAKALKAGQEFTALVTFRVSEITIHDKADTNSDPYDGLYGRTRIELEAKELSVQGMEVPESGDDEEDGSSALKKFLNNKAKTANPVEDED